MFHSRTIAPAAVVQDRVSQIVHDGDGKRTRATCGEDDTSDLNSTLTAGLSNLDDRFWIIDIIKFSSSSCNDGPGFAEDTSSGRNLQSVVYQVGAGVKEDDLATCRLRKLCEMSKRERRKVEQT
jgi:hypothetical protein